MTNSEVTHQFDLADVRAAILADWRVPASVTFDATERAQVERLWNELKRTESVRAWDSMIVLCGRLTEALLRRRIADAHVADSRITTATLAKLVTVASEHGLFVAGGYTAANGTVLNTTRRLRNWAAHSSDPSVEIGEREATQQLAILVAFTESIYPARREFVGIRPRTSLDSLDQYWHLCRPKQLLDLLSAHSEDCSDFVSPRATRFYDHVIRNGSLRTTIELLAFARCHDLDPEPLRESLVRNFPTILRNLRRASLRRMVDLVSAFRVFSLRPHSLILAVLIPMDEDILLALLRALSPHKAARRLEEVAKANQMLFRHLALRFSRIDELTKVVWSAWDGTSTSYVANRFTLAWILPRNIRRAIIDTAPPGAIRVWASTGTFRHVLGVLLTRTRAGPHGGPELSYTETM
jgi:hypothetical protein